MSNRYETVHLRTPEPGDLSDKPRGDFAAVRVGGALDGYQVVENLAEGGMGAVFRAVDREGDKVVALKTPLPGGRGGTYHHRLRRFLREARLTSRMDHDGVAKVRDQGQCDGLPYFTLDIIDGVPLSDRLYEEGVLPIVEAVRIVEQTARAAHHVHEKGVVHRDLKPANILIRPDGTPVIIDFGLARDALGIDPRITESGIWLGTPAYIAPEQALGEASRVDGKADVYSLGAVLYELLTGLPPYGVGSPRSIFKALRREEPKPPSELRAVVPECLDDIVMKSLARDQKTRYPNAEAFANALADLLAEFETDPPEDDVESSALSCSWDLEGSNAEISDDTVVGWNDKWAAGDDDPILIPTSDDQPVLEPIPDATPVKRKKLSTGKTKSVRRSGKRAAAAGRSNGKLRSGVRRRQQTRRRNDSADTFSRYLAFGGPALVAVIGLLLLI